MSLKPVNLAVAMALVLVAQSAYAQEEKKKTPVDSANPKTPSECVRYQLRPAMSKVSDLSMAPYRQDSVEPAKLRVPFETVNRMMDSTGSAIAGRCLPRYSMKKLPLDELPSLAELYGAMGEIDKIGEIVRYHMSHKLTPEERKSTLSQYMSTLDGAKGPKAKRDTYRDQYLAELDKLGDVALAERIQKRVFWYNSDDTTAELRRRHEAMALIAKVKDSTTRESVGWSAGYAWINTAQHYIDQGDFRAAEAIADSGMEVLKDWPQRPLGELAGYAKFGEKMGTVDATNWFNVPMDFKQYVTGQGKLTLIEVTSYW
jgi:hypothetical protein